MQDKTSEESENDYFGKSSIEAQKVIVFLPLLLSLFGVCRTANCGAGIDEENKKVHFSGAMVTISVTCNNGHDFKWDSSTKLGKGKNQVATINVLLGSFNYLCGLNVKKVFSFISLINLMEIFKLLEFFGCLRIVCISRSFIFQMQTKVLYNVIWAFWQYMQVTIGPSEVRVLPMCPYFSSRRG